MPKAQGLLKAGGKQRSDATHILAQVRALNRSECVVESLRAALNVIATADPEWLKAWVPKTWFERYSLRVEESRLVKGKQARVAYLAQGAYSAEDLAAALGLSKRTLQRQLSAQNVTFQDLLDIYRQEQAVLMLQNGERNMSRVAYALGYHEQSSFNRAFRRWTKQSPSTWLQSNTG